MRGGKRGFFLGVGVRFKNVVFSRGGSSGISFILLL